MWQVSGDASDVLDTQMIGLYPIYLLQFARKSYINKF